MVWRNEWEVDGLARVCAKVLVKRHRVNRELSEGVGGEGEGWIGRWLRRMVEIVARGVERMGV